MPEIVTLLLMAIMAISITLIESKVANIPLKSSPNFEAILQDTNITEFSLSFMNNSVSPSLYNYLHKTIPNKKCHNPLSPRLGKPEMKAALSVHASWTAIRCLDKRPSEQTEKFARANITRTFEGLRDVTHYQATLLCGTVSDLITCRVYKSNKTLHRWKIIDSNIEGCVAQVRCFLRLAHTA